MNREVEERIVAMYFDNKDFEKNAKETIDTLGQLKKELNFEDSAKGFSAFDKISKSLNFDKANQGLRKMKSTLTTMGNVFKKIFEVTPIDNAYRALKNFKNKYFDRVIGFNIANKLVNSIESAFRKLTIQPISAGWSQYESKMDSVKTIMSSTGESLDVVNNKLEEMTGYANKTIYSLTDMTSNLGKFTNNGVDLERSVKAMEGIANATADAGQGAQQASMAMYNISQAIGVGKMTTIDWKSLENANIATTKLKNTFLEMAALQGKIEKKVAKDGSITYMLTKGEDGEKLKEAVELTAANFREYLSKGWLDKETMLRAFEVYSGTVTETTLESWGIHDTETKRYFMELGQSALESATQVRTFSKMMDALSESAQSGWAKSFELIFGNMEQGTTLWTTINNVLDDILTKSAEARNSMLQTWAGEDQNVDAEKKQLEEKNELLKQQKQYLADLEHNNSITNVDREIDHLHTQIAQYQKQIEEIRNSDRSKADKDALIQKKNNQINELKKTEKKLQDKKKELERQEAAKAKDNATAATYQAEIDKYNKEIEELRKSNVKDSEGDIDKKKVEARDSKIAQKQKLVNDLQKKIDKLNSKYGDDEIEKTKKEIAQLEKEIKDLDTLIEDKTGHDKSEYVDEQGRSGRDIAIATLFELIDLAKELGSAISDAFHNVFGTLDAGGLFDITQKIAKVVHNIVTWFGKAEDQNSRLHKIQKGLQGVFSIAKALWKITKTIINLVTKIARPVFEWFIEVFGNFGKAFDGLGDLSPAEIIIKIGDKMKAAWEKIKAFFTPKAIFDDKGNYVSTDIPVITWLKKLWNKVKDIVHEWANESGFGQVYNIVSEWWHKISKALGEAKEALIDKWQEVKKWFIDTGISQFFTDIWGWISSLFTPEKKVIGWVGNGQLIYEETTPVSSFFNSIRKGIEKAYKDLQEWWARAGISEFFQGIWNAVSDAFTSKSGKRYNGSMMEEYTEDAPIVKFFKEIKARIDKAFSELKSWWDLVKEPIIAFFTGIWNAVSDIFTSKSGKRYNGSMMEEYTEDAPIVKFFKEIKAGIDKAFSELKSWWDLVKEPITAFFTGIWDAVSGAFTPKSGKRYNGSMLEEYTEDAPIVKFFKNIWHGLEGVWGHVETWWNQVKGPIEEFATGIWNAVSGVFTSKSGKRYNGSMLEEYTEDAPIVKFFKGIWQGLVNTWDKLSGWWETVKEPISAFFTDIWTSVSGWFTEDKDGKGTGFVKFLSDVGAGINEAWRFIKEDIPWDKIGEFLTNTWNFIVNLISGEESADDADNKSGAQKIAGRTRAAAGAISDTSYNMSKISKETDKVDPKKTDRAIEIIQKVLGAIGDFFSTVFEAVKGVVITPELARFFDNVGTFLNGFLNIVGTFLGSLGRLGTAVATGDFSETGWGDVFTVAIPALILLAANLFSYFKAKNLSKISGGFNQSIGLQFLEICGGLLMLASALALLTTVNEEKLKSGALILGAFAVVIGIILGIVSKIKGAGQEQNPTTSSERILTNLINTLGKAGMLYIIVQALPEIIKTISEAKQKGAENIGDDLLKICEGIAILVGGISLVMAVVNKLSGNQGINPKAAFLTAASIGIFVATLTTILAAMVHLFKIPGYFPSNNYSQPEEALIDLVHTLNYAEQILEALGGAIGGFIRGIFGIKSDTEKADEATKILEMLGDKMSVFSMEKVSGISRMLTLIASITDGSVKFDTGKMASFASCMGDLGSGVYEIAGYLQEVEGPLSELHNPESIMYQKLQGFSEISKMIGDAMTSFSGSGSWDTAVKRLHYLAQKGVIEQFVNDLQVMLNYLGDLKDPSTGIQFDGLMIVQKLYEAIQQGLIDPSLPAFDATSIVDSITTAIGLGSSTIAQLVHEMVQNGLELSGSTEGTGSAGEYSIPGSFTSALTGFLNGDTTDTDLNGMIEEFFGDESTWNSIMGEFDTKTGALSEKMSAMGDSFDMSKWLPVTNTENGEQTDIVSYIQGQLNELGTTLDTMEPLEVRITPVFDMTNMTSDKLQEALANHPVSLPIYTNNGRMQISFNGLRSELQMDSVISHLDNVSTRITTQSYIVCGAINSLSSHMDSIANEVANLKLVLDTGLLVGAIAPRVDFELGNRESIGARTGVVSYLPK